MSDPQRVGPYRIMSLLGSGGMGRVYLGRSPGGRAVAVKVVRPELAADPEFRQRFAREVEAARAVGGAFTAAVIDADPLGDPPWLATVYVPGPPLGEVVHAFGPLPEPYVRLLGAGLAEALLAIHAAGVVHRDLKPSNVVVAEDGPRVIDFGISRLDGASRLTVPGLVFGTPGYMSPEQITGMSAGPASDVFALAGVLVFAATGRPPFGETPEAMYRVVHEEPDLTGLSQALLEVIGPCLLKRPELRPTLDTLLAGLAISPEAAMAWPPPSIADYIRRHQSEPRPSRSHLRLHIQALLDAGLTDRMVVEAVSHGRV